MDRYLFYSKSFTLSTVEDEITPVHVRREEFLIKSVDFGKRDVVIHGQNEIQMRTIRGQGAEIEGEQDTEIEIYGMAADESEPLHD